MAAVLLAAVLASEMEWAAAWVSAVRDAARAADPTDVDLVADSSVEEVF
jgi:hypothetical protein